MTRGTWQKTIRTIGIMALSGTLLSGCAAPHLTTDTSEVRFQLQWPPVEIERYEPVIYPAGPIN